MKLGDIIAQKGVIIRGRVILDKAPVIASIIKSKMRPRVVHTTIAKPQVVRDVQVTNSGLFKDEMERLGNIKERQDNRIPLGTRHMRFKNKEFSFSEAMCVTKDSQLKRLGRIPCNFDNIEMKATNRSK
jgi:hypothetical protein